MKSRLASGSLAILSVALIGGGALRARDSPAAGGIAMPHRNEPAARPAAALTSPSGTAAPAAQAAGPLPFAQPLPAAADEAFAKALSADKAAAYLDAIAVNWTHQKKCGTCHTNYAYMMARPALGGGAGGSERAVRAFFDDRVYRRLSRPALPHTLILAGVLSINDARRGHLSAGAREALDQAWEMQNGDGAWDYPRIFYSPPLGDPWYGAAMVALGAGLAPDGYAATPAARAGLARLAAWFARNPAPSLHHRTILLWASYRTPGLLSRAGQQQTERALLALQHADGGWALPSLGDWNRRDGSPNDPAGPSDGYATGLVSYVLQQGGHPATDRPIAAALTWLKSNQRESGRWFTHSVNTTDKGHLISNIGTAYAVMALEAGGQLRPVRTAARH